MDYVGSEGDEARALIRELRSVGSASKTLSLSGKGAISMLEQQQYRPAPPPLAGISSSASPFISRAGGGRDLFGSGQSSSGGMGHNDSDILMTDASGDDARLLGELSMSMDEDN